MTALGGPHRLAPLPLAMNRFERVAVDVARDEIQRHRRSRTQAGLRHALRCVDTLIAALEELHLAGRLKVPRSFQPQLDELNRALPPDLRHQWRTGVTIVHAADHLFDIQEQGLRRMGVMRTPDDEGGEGDSAA